MSTLSNHIQSSGSHPSVESRLSSVRQISEYQDWLRCPACLPATSAMKRTGGTLACSVCGSSYESASGLDLLMTNQDANLFGLHDAGFAGVPQSDERVLSRQTRAASLLRNAKNTITPVNETAQRAVGAILQQAEILRRPLNVLVVGGGTAREDLSSLLESELVRSVIFDVYPSDQIDFLADGHRIPMETAVFDAVWIQAVLEHVAYPWEVAAEIERVTKLGGLIYAETPFMQSVHEGAYDFFRFGYAGAQLLFAQSNAIDHGVVAGSGVALQWAFRDVAVSLFGERSFPAKLAYIAGLPISRVGRKRIQRNLDRASSIGVLLERSKRRVSVADVVASYGP